MNESFPNLPQLKSIHFKMNLYAVNTMPTFMKHIRWAVYFGEMRLDETYWDCAVTRLMIDKFIFIMFCLIHEIRHTTSTGDSVFRESHQKVWVSCNLYLQNYSLKTLEDLEWLLKFSSRTLNLKSHHKQASNTNITVEFSKRSHLLEMNLSEFREIVSN